MHESMSDTFIFSADKSTISRSPEAVGQDGYRGLSAACLVCSPLLSAGVQRPGLPDLCSLPLTKVSASNREKLNKIVLQRPNLDLLACAVSGVLAGCPFRGPLKAAGKVLASHIPWA